MAQKSIIMSSRYQQVTHKHSMVICIGWIRQSVKKERQAGTSRLQVRVCQTHLSMERSEVTRAKRVPAHWSARYVPPKDTGIPANILQAVRSAACSFILCNGKGAARLGDENDRRGRVPSLAAGITHFRRERNIRSNARVTSRKFNEKLP